MYTALFTDRSLSVFIDLLNAHIIWTLAWSSEVKVAVLLIVHYRDGHLYLVVGHWHVLVCLHHTYRSRDML